MTDGSVVLLKGVACFVLFVTLQVFPFSRYSAGALLQLIPDVLCYFESFLCSAVFYGC